MRVRNNVDQDQTGAKQNRSITTKKIMPYNLKNILSAIILYLLNTETNLKNMSSI